MNANGKPPVKVPLGPGEAEWLEKRRHSAHKAPEPGCDLCDAALDEAREVIAEQREAEREAMD